MKSRISALLVLATAVLSALSSISASAQAGAVDQATLSGSVRNHGTPVAGADVVAIAWPNQRVLASLANGEAVPQYVVGKLKTDSLGSFSLPVDLMAAPATFREGDGSVDIELVVVNRDREMRFNTTVGSKTESTLSYQRHVRPAHDVTFDLGAATAVDANDDPSTWIDATGNTMGKDGRSGSARSAVLPISQYAQHLVATSLPTLRQEPQASPGIVAGSHAGNSLAVAPAVGCVAYASTIQYNLEEYFMRAWAWSGALATVHQDASSSHTLGIGFQDGSTWNASGTQTITLAAKAVVGNVADAYAWNKINYRDYRYTCVPWVYRKPLSVGALLTKWTYSPHQTFSTCVTYTAPGVYGKSSGTNVTYGAGMDIGPINVSAKSGWDSRTEIAWNVKSKTKICGSTSSGWVSSPQASASKG